MADVDGPTWKVGQLARLSGLTVRTLHHYDQVDRANAVSSS